MTEKRIFGLDIFRALSILLVLIGHLGMAFGSDHQDFFYYSAFYGVEMFFVLSGFLIGKILIDLTFGNITSKSVFIFWSRRWLRTLPLYYIILILKLIVEGHHFPYLHFVFLQNTIYSLNYDYLWFNEAWSLGVEEYFYLLFPLLIFILSLIIRSTKIIILISSLIVFLICFYCKYQYAYSGSWVDYDYVGRKTVLFRFDAIACGVIVAYLNKFHLRIFKLLEVPLIPILLLILLIFLHVNFSNFLIYDFHGLKQIPVVYGFVINSFILCLFIPFFNRIRGIKSAFKFKCSIVTIVTNISLFSYFMYLTHTSIFHLFIDNSQTKLINSIFGIFSLALLYFLGFLSYRYIEKPIFIVRDKWTK